MTYEWEKGLFTVPYGDDYSKAMANILFGELKDLSNANHDDVADATLRAEKIIKNNETLEVSYDKEFRVYRREEKASIPNRLINSRHV
jgi:hypothetical protein